MNFLKIVVFWVFEKNFMAHMLGTTEIHDKTKHLNVGEV